MFRKVLIANRGEVACRIARTCRRLGIATVAVYSDADAGALHVSMADEAVRIGPSPVQESYLRGDVIVQAARATGTEAVHPGYGLASERAAFARLVREAGLVFVGPSDAALEVFGDKIRARALADGALVAVPPGMAEPLPDEADPVPHAERIGYPIMVKAAAGGGGIGMLVVDGPDKLERAVKTCRDRARSAFGDGRVYLERYLASPKHIEVQVIADAHGNVVSLGERECSLQRRHQKVIEESPSPAPFFAGSAGDARKRAIEEAALRVFRAGRYVGAGTCEFIVDDQGQAYFLEVNARLQVEHPVTEMCTGLDIVELQLRVAEGASLSAEALNPTRAGHSIEARIYAEDPSKGFIPQPGRLRALAWPEASPDLRVETGVRQGDVVTPFYDPLLAKIVAHGASRGAALTRLRRALGDTRIELDGAKGPAQTNLAFLVAVLESDSFTAGTYDTHFGEAFAKGRR